MTGTTAFELAALRDDLYRDGIVALRGAFSPRWADDLREDLDELLAEALTRPDGAVGRGPRRYYVAIHPERLRGFVDIATHPWITAVAEAVLGADYRLIEVGFDVPLPGAVNQPWHRDFASPPDTYQQHRITSLAINITTVDTTPEMGPFEIAPGTHWEAGTDFEHGMFPPASEYPRYAAMAVRKLPQRGDVSIRTALTVHRGTANVSDRARPVLVIGIVTGDGDSGSDDSSPHDLVVTRHYYESLPEQVRAHLGARLVDRLTPLQQKHTIEGLVMGQP